MAWWNRFFSWFQKTFKRRRSSPHHTAAVKDSVPQTLTLEAPLTPCVTVIIPALNEEVCIADVVRFAFSDSATAEVIVVDDSSIDNTREQALKAGATVITSTLLGKGASMADGVRVAQHELLVFLDGDLKGLRSGIITDLVRPLIAGRAEFVKARFGRGGGRVTELTAKPMLKVFFPELAHFNQPLGGIIGARRSLLNQLTFEDGYGVDIGLLLDAWRNHAKLMEIDIGHLEHDSQPLLDLTSMANEVSRVIYSRARESGRLHVEQITAMYENQRQATASWEYVMTRQKSRRKLLLLDMDGTVTSSRFATMLAQATDQALELEKHLDTGNADTLTRTRQIAQLFRFVHRKKFESVAKEMPIRPGVIAAVNAFKRAGFMVGIVSDSYFVAAEILRKRIFADFALAHTVQFQGDVCTGELTLNSAFLSDTDDANEASISKHHVVKLFKNKNLALPFETIWAVGDNDNDHDLLCLANKAWVIEPKSPRLNTIPGIMILQDFDQLRMALLNDEAASATEPAINLVSAST